MPAIPMTEPVAPRYIHINPETNLVHLMVPVVGGQEISTDNTCKAMVELKDFFDGGALRELNAYKDALESDIQLLALLAATSPERALKEMRLTQIDAYIEAIKAMSYSYSDAVTTFLTRPSNLYSIQLRPRIPDSLSSVVNPTAFARAFKPAGEYPSYGDVASRFTSVAMLAAAFRVIPINR